MSLLSRLSSTAAVALARTSVVTTHRLPARGVLRALQQSDQHTAAAPSQLLIPARQYGVTAAVHRGGGAAAAPKQQHRRLTKKTVPAGGGTGGQLGRSAAVLQGRPPTSPLMQPSTAESATATATTREVADCAEEVATQRVRAGVAPPKQQSCGGDTKVNGKSGRRTSKRAPNTRKRKAAIAADQSEGRPTSDADTTTTRVAAASAADSGDDFIPNAELECFMRMLQDEVVLREEKFTAEKQRWQQQRRSTAESVKKSDEANISEHSGAPTAVSKVALEADCLAEDQRLAVSLAVEERRNLFITGGAGTGKSLVLREIVLRLQERRSNVYVTASTGVAALNVRGATINSFSGVGYGVGTTEELVKKVRASRRAAGRWRYCSTLIIDEVSMLTADLLNKLDQVARVIRAKPDLPFGGIQVILCGDFLQLPPIPSRSRRGRGTAGKSRVVLVDEASVLRGSSAEGPQRGRQSSSPAVVQYCFQSEAWRELNLTTVVLHEKFRQGADAEFQRVLDDVRVGTLTAPSFTALSARAVTDQEDSHAHAVTEGLSPLHESARHFVRVCGTNKEVDARNAKHFALLEPITRKNDICSLAHTDDGGVADNDVLSLQQQQGHEAVAEEAALRAKYQHDPLRALHVYTAHDVVFEEKRGSDGKTQRVAHALGSNSSQGLTRGDAFDRGGGGIGGGEGDSSGQLADPRASWVNFHDSNLHSTLPLKVGTRVMLVHNVSPRLGLVNGSVGVVTGFLHPLEMVDLALRAPREHYKATDRGDELLLRGGFDSLDDVFRCVDTSYAQSLYWWLRNNHAGVRQVDDLSYGAVYGEVHLRNVQWLTGVDEIATDDGELISAIAGRGGGDGSPCLLGDSERDLDDFLRALMVPSGARGSGGQASELFLGGLLPLHLQMMRLPVVRFNVKSLAAVTHANDDDDGTNGGSGGGGAGKPKSNGKRRGAAPTHVFAYVSPIEQQWFMGNSVVATRTQVPLRHAWAITVHKSQGLTIASLQVDMARFFTPGQAYVALSRATSLENIQLLNFNPEGIRACAEAKAFYRALEENTQPQS